MNRTNDKQCGGRVGLPLDFHEPLLPPVLHGVDAGVQGGPPVGGMLLHLQAPLGHLPRLLPLLALPVLDPVQVLQAARTTGLDAVLHLYPS